MYASATVLEAPQLQPVTLDLVRRHCRIDAGYDDDLLEVYAASATMWAEAYLNRALITQTLRYEVTNTPPPTASSLVVGILDLAAARIGNLRTSPAL
jgi:Phage gp6-like head-tail connector protein